VFLAHVRALIRRRASRAQARVIAGDLCVDFDRRTVSYRSQPIELTPKEYAVLTYLVRHAGRVVPRSEIVEHVWDENHDPSSHVIDVLFSSLRRKLAAHEAEHIVRTLRGHGYLVDIADPGPGSPGQRLYG
jgi:DNA-binding response OmpR family regulator